MKIFGQQADMVTDIDTLLARLTALRAGYLDELAAGNIPTDLSTINDLVDDIETRLTAVRADYLDQLDFNLQEAVAAIPTTAMRGTDLALLAANYATERGTDDAALASSWTADLATVLANYTETRAGYLDELAAANIPTDIGENDDGHDGATLFGRLQQLIEHIHTRQYVYPTLADGVTLTTGAGDWGLGTITEIAPANAISFAFDIHEILVEDVNTQDKTYEIVLYYGGSDIECGRTRFAATSLKGGVPAVAMQTIIIPANSRVKSQLAIQDGGSKTAKVSLRYHPY